MSAQDIIDALASSTPVYTPGQLRTAWRNRAAGFEGVDSLDDLSRQQGQTYTITQSFDDGMPSEVTSTSGNDAGGKFGMDDLGARRASPAMLVPFGNLGAQGSFFGSSIPVSVDIIPLVPGDVILGMYDILCMTFLSSGAPANMTLYPPIYTVAAQNTVGNLTMIIFTRSFTPTEYNEPAWDIAWDRPVSWSATRHVYYPQDAAGHYMIPVLESASVSIVPNTLAGAAISSPPMVVSNAGALMTYFSNDDNSVWTPGSGNTNFAGGSSSATPHTRLMTMVETGAVPFTTIHPAGTYQLQASMVGAINNTTVHALVGGIVVAGYQYPELTSREFFSPFNTASPIVNFSRDISDLTYDFGIITGLDPEFVRLFTGQMADLPVSGQSASIDGVSATRLNMQKSIQIPPICGPKQGANATWVAHYAAANCGKFASPAPTELARAWIPCHGSMYPFMADKEPSRAGIRAQGIWYNNNLFGLFDLSLRPTTVNGPFLNAMYAWQGPGDGYELSWQFAPYAGYWPNFPNRPLADFPAVPTGSPAWTYNDMLSQLNSVGRISCWIRGDATTGGGLPYYVGTAGIFEFQANTAQLCSVRAWLGQTDRKFNIQLNDGVTQYTLATGIVLPSDGQWHYISFSWDWAGNKVKVYLGDGVASSGTASPTMTASHLAASEAADNAAHPGADRATCKVSSRLPVCEILLECGATVYASAERDSGWGANAPFVPTFITEPVNLELEAPGEPAPRDAWSVFVDVCTSSLSAFRTDEQDSLVMATPEVQGVTLMMLTAADTFSRTVGSGWGSTSTGGLAYTNDGTTSVATVTGRPSGIHTIAATGSITHSRLAAIDTTAYDVTVLLTFNALATGAGLRQEVYGRSPDNTHYISHVAQFETTGLVTCSLIANRGAGEVVLATKTSAAAYTSGIQTWLRARAVGSNVYVKVWPQLLVEPPDWTLVATDDTVVSGDIVFVSQRNAGNTNAAVQATFDTVSISIPSTPAVIDTTYNAQDLDVQADPTKIRNDVTVSFSDTSVSVNPLSVLQVTDSLTVIRGISYATFAVNAPIAYLDSVSPIMANLTAAQVNTPTLPTGTHYVTLNTATDGTGTYLTSSQVAVRVWSFTTSTITVQFINTYIKPVYLVNGGSSVPFINVVGQAVTIVDGYSTESDAASITARGDRTLSVSAPFIQRRDAAEPFAAALVSRLSQPKGQMTVHVMGDPTRLPGDIVTVTDSEGTGANGLWRNLSIKHNGNGAEYTQDLSLVQILPPAVWDTATAWDLSSWGE